MNFDDLRAIAHNKAISFKCRNTDKISQEYDEEKLSKIVSISIMSIY